MSKYQKLETKFTDADCLREALKAAGIPFEEHTVAQPLFGFEGDVRSERANFIVRRQNVGSAANDVGFVRRESGQYEAIISDWDMSRGGKRIMGQVREQYGLAKLKKNAKAKGMTVVGVKTENGKMKVTLRGYQ